VVRTEQGVGIEICDEFSFFRGVKICQERNAQAYLLEMVAIPPRMLFSIIRYAWGSVMRSNYASVYFNAMAQAREGSVIKGKQSNLCDSYVVHRKCSKTSARRRTSVLR